MSPEGGLPPTRTLLRIGAVAFGMMYAGIRLFVVPRVEAWNLVGADADGAMVWASLGASNTGFLDQQLTTRLLVIPANQEYIEHRAQWGPAVLDERGVSAGADLLRANDRGWELRVGGGGLGARLDIPGARPACPPDVGRMGGMVEDEVDGRLVTGPAIIVRTRAEGWVRGSALYVLGDTFAAGIDPSSECPAWVRAGDDTWTGAAIDFPLDRNVDMHLGPWTLSFRSAQDALVHDGWAHASLPERWIARFFGFHPPITEIHRVVARIQDSREGGAAAEGRRSPKTLLAPGIVVRWR